MTLSVASSYLKVKSLMVAGKVSKVHMMLAQYNGLIQENYPGEIFR